jgi:hypothetical protein
MSRLSTKQRRAQRRRHAGYHHAAQWAATWSTLRMAAAIVRHVFPYLAPWVGRVAP